MGRDQILQRDDGTENIPGTHTPWEMWASASRTRNFFHDEPLLDWLELYGRDNGFLPDTETDKHDPRCSFLDFVLRKGNAFEGRVVAYLKDRFDIVQVSKGPADIRDHAATLRTWEEMCSGREIIAQAVLWNPQTQTYGAADLLVRSDKLNELVPHSLDADEASIPAEDIPGASWHYRVVDVKFTTLKLLKDGHAGGNHSHYMAQVWLYNAALGRIQGYIPPSAYLLGRAWEQNKARGSAAFERLERVDRDGIVGRQKERLEDLVTQACDWVRLVRSQGRDWQVLPEPSDDRLRPNMRNTEDAPWHAAKVEIAQKLEDLTMFPRVNPLGRAAAMQSGLTRWTDPGCSASSLGVTGNVYPLQVDAVIQANHSPEDGPIVFPPKVGANEESWRVPKRAEFYVDFETVNDLDDDFSTFPEKGGQALICMIGCGHLTDPNDLSSWTFRVFTVDRLTEDEEHRIINEWLQHVNEVCVSSGTTLSESRLYHWAPAETSTLSDAYNAASRRHGLPAWDTLPWVDLLNRVIKAQPVTVRGAFGFGLKAFSKAMHRAGLIETDWTDGPADGLGAMVGTWWCNKQAEEQGCSMTELPLMKEIESYNQVDCRVMVEIVSFLRRKR